MLNHSSGVRKKIVVVIIIQKDIKKIFKKNANYLGLWHIVQSGAATRPTQQSTFKPLSLVSSTIKNVAEVTLQRFNEYYPHTVQSHVFNKPLTVIHSLIFLNSWKK